MRPARSPFPLRPALALLVGWAALMLLLVHLLQQSRAALEREAAQHASSAALALAERYEGLFAQSRQWAEELSRLVSADELLREAPPTEARLAEVGLWIDDLHRRNPQLASIGFLDAQGRSFRQRGKGGSGQSQAGSDYWEALTRLGSAGKGRFVASKPQRLRSTGKLGIVHAHGVYAHDGHLAGAIVIGFHLDELAERLKGLREGAGSVALLLDADDQPLLREPPLGAGPLPKLPYTREAGPLPGTYLGTSPYDGKRRLAALVPLRKGPYQVAVALAEDDYLAGWRVYRRDIGLAMGALSAAAGLLLLLLQRNARATQALARSETLLGSTLELLPGPCLHARGEPPRVVHANAAARQRLGLASGQRPLLIQLFDEPLAGERLLIDAQRRGETLAQDLRLRRLGGDEGFWAAVQLRAEPGSGDLLFSFLDVEERRRREEELQRQSGTDALTGLCNRHAFYRFAEQLMAHCRRLDEPMAVAMVDLDHFKAINDRFGHPGGDAVLRAVAQRLQAQRRGSDVVARIGGEEFALLLPSTELEAAEGIAQRLLQQLRVPAIELSAGIAVQVTASIGLSAWLVDEDDIDWALARADAALYRAKAEGRDRYAVAL